MRLICYPTLAAPPVIRPAPVRRAWMDETTMRSAYRCLPLVIANSHGWELLVDRPFTATWNGGPGAEDLQVSFPDGGDSLLPASHFGHGVLSFQVGYLFETEEQYNLWIMGPVNWPKDGAMPLCGVVEADWLPYTFSMNWLLTRPGTVRFEAGDPFCHVFPVPRQLLAEVEPEIHRLDEVPEKNQAYTTWLTSREAAVDRLRRGQMAPSESVWNRHYVRGQVPGGESLAKDHETRLQVKPFTDRRA